MYKIILAITALLVGCTTFDQRAFDPVEYNYAVMTTVDATRVTHLCGDVAHADKFKAFANDLNTDSMMLFEYETHHAVNTHSFASISEMRDLVSDTVVHAPYSTKACVHKFSEIQSASRTIARALGGLEQFNICDSDVTSRYAVYEASYKAGEITKAEFTELVGDIVKLGKVDQASCSFESKEKLANAIDSITRAASFLTAIPGL